MNETPCSLGSRFNPEAVHPPMLSPWDLRSENWPTVAKKRSKLPPRKNKKFLRGTCLVCGGSVFSSHKEQKYCSPKCSGIAHGQNNRGENNARWLGGVSKNNYRYRLRQKARYPDRCKARELVGRAIRSGKLARGACEKCGTPNGHAHHDDYAKPLEVRWFCRKHHREQHGGKH